MTETDKLKCVLSRYKFKTKLEIYTDFQSLFFEENLSYAMYFRTCQQYLSVYKIHTRSVENQNVLPLILPPWSRRATWQLIYNLNPQTNINTFHPVVAIIRTVLRVSHSAKPLGWSEYAPLLKPPSKDYEIYAIIWRDGDIMTKF